MGKVNGGNILRKGMMNMRNSKWGTKNRGKGLWPSILSFRLPIMMGVIVSLFLITSNVFAEIPQTITYQGKLVGSTGSPLTGDYNLQFKIYDVDSGGDALWTESHTAVPVSNGRFNIILGSLTTLPTSIFSGEDRWLGIKVGDDFEMTPRMKMTGVGFAFKAYNTDKLGGVSSSEFLTSSSGDSSYVKKTGSTMTGALTMDANINVKSDKKIFLDTAKTRYIGFDVGAGNVVRLAGGEFQVDSDQMLSLGSSGYGYLKCVTSRPVIYGYFGPGLEITDSTMRIRLGAGDWGSEKIELSDGTNYFLLMSGVASVSATTVDLTSSGNTNINSSGAINLSGNSIGMSSSGGSVDLSAGGPLNLTSSGANQINLNSNVYATSSTIEALAFKGDGSELTNISAGMSTEDADTRYVQKTGDTMTGTLTLDADINLLDNRRVYLDTAKENSIYYDGGMETSMMLETATDIRMFNTASNALLKVGVNDIDISYSDSTNGRGSATIRLNDPINHRFQISTGSLLGNGGNGSRDIEIITGNVPSGTGVAGDIYVKPGGVLPGSTGTGGNVIIDATGAAADHTKGGSVLIRSDNNTSIEGGLIVTGVITGDGSGLSNVATDKVSKSGDTMTGALTIDNSHMIISPEADVSRALEIKPWTNSAYAQQYGIYVAAPVSGSNPAIYGGHFQGGSSLTADIIYKNFDATDQWAGKFSDGTRNAYFATGGSIGNWAGYFDGNVKVTGTIEGGSPVKIKEGIEMIIPPVNNNTAFRAIDIPWDLNSNGGGGTHYGIYVDGPTSLYSTVYAGYFESGGASASLGFHDPANHYGGYFTDGTRKAYLAQLDDNTGKYWAGNFSGGNVRVDGNLQVTGTIEGASPVKVIGGMKVTGTVTIEDKIAIEGWTDATLGSAWQNFDSGGNQYARAGYYKDPYGIVHLRGLVQMLSTEDGYTVIFTLPSGYQPERRKIFPVWFGNHTYGAVDITSNVNEGGTQNSIVLRAVPDINELVSLDGITYRAAGY